MTSSSLRWSWLSSVEWDMLGMGVRLLIGSGGGWPPPGRPGGQNCDGALFQQGPYRDTPHRSGGCLFSRSRRPTDQSQGIESAGCVAGQTVAAEERLHNVRTARQDSQLR